MAKTRKSVSARPATPQKVTANRKPAAVTINSHRDLQIHYESVMAQQKTRGDKLAALLTTNIGATDLIRTEFLRFLLDGPRDIDAECGYPAFLTPEHYRAMYDREGAAKRVVECFPEETWAMDPEVYEDEDPQTETEFETAWNALLQKHNIWSYLKRFDILSGIGQYGILLLGVDDGKDMRDPVDNLNDDGTWDPPPKQCNLLYMRPFSEEVVFVKTRETDTNSPRYGLPTRYTIQFRDFPNWGIQAGEIIARDVHWTRVIHFADNKKQSEIYGLPRMQQVYNRLYDLRKIYACAGEAYWKGGFPGLVFEVNPELADQGLTLDTDTLRKEFENYQAGLQRYLAVTGVTTKSLPPQFVDPTGPAEANLKAIAVALNIPYRKLFGTEESKLAGDQDDRSWNKRVASRQTHTVNPLIIRPLVDRFIALGVLPPPESGEYEVEWPDLNSPTDQDKAGVALTRTQAMQGYILGNVSQLVPPDVYLEKELGYTPDEIANIAEAAQEQAAMEETPEEMDEEQEEQGEGQENENDNEGDLAASSVPDQGNALLQKDLDGSTTIPPKGKRVDATFVEQPDLNSSGLKTNTWSDAAREASIEVREAEAKGKTTEDEDKEGVDDGDGSDAEDKGIISKFDSMYPRAGAVIEGRKVTSKVPNTDSIASTLDDYHVLPGIRDFPIYDAKGEGFGGINSYYAADDQRRVKGLMEKLKTSGKIAPLIIVQAKDGPYVLEGGHRMSALVELGAKRVPAMVVLDLEDLRGGDEPRHNTSGRKKGGQASANPFVQNEGDSDTDGHWVTINGAHVFIKDGEVTKGPAGMIGKKQTEIANDLHKKLGGIDSYNDAAAKQAKTDAVVQKMQAAVGRAGKKADAIKSQIDTLSNQAEAEFHAAYAANPDEKDLSLIKRGDNILDGTYLYDGEELSVKGGMIVSGPGAGQSVNGTIPEGAKLKVPNGQLTPKIIHIQNASAISDSLGDLWKDYHKAKEAAKAKALEVVMGNRGQAMIDVKPVDPPVGYRDMTKGVTAFKKMLGKGTSLPEVGLFSNAYVPDSPYTKSGRSFAVRSSIFMAPNAGAATTVHELGHVLEHVDQGVHERAMDFLARRTKGKSLEPMSKLTGDKNYGDDEKARDGGFFHPYVGKDYGKDSSEVISMGFEQMYRDPLEFAQKDRDHFNLIYNIMHRTD